MEKIYFTCLIKNLHFLHPLGRAFKPQTGVRPRSDIVYGLQPYRLKSDEDKTV